MSCFFRSPAGVARRCVRSSNPSCAPAIQDPGDCPAALRVPSTRALAADLGVSRGVIVLAYEQLMAEGYLTAARGSATRVVMRRPPCQSQAAAVQPVAAPRYDFRPGLPDVSLFPRRAWLSSLRRVLDAATADALGYPDPHGALRRAHGAGGLPQSHPRHGRAPRTAWCCAVATRRACGSSARRCVRAACAAWPWRIPATAANAPTSRPWAWASDPCPWTAAACASSGCVGLDVGAVLVTPAHQFPTGVVLAPERRAALLEWAARRRAVIIEDDYDAEYRFDREPIGALQGLADDAVAYLGSASKTLAPALRIGWLVLPPALVDRVALAKLHADHGSPTLDQLAFADFLERDGLDRHLRKVRPLYRRRRDALIAALRTRLPGLQRGGRGGRPAPHGEPAAGHVTKTRSPMPPSTHSLRIYGVGPHQSRPGPPALLLGYASLSESRHRGGRRTARDGARGHRLRPRALGARAGRRASRDPAERSLAARLAAPGD